MEPRAGSLLVGVLLCALVAASCSSAGDSDEPGPSPGTTADVGGLVELLAAAGIGVYDEPTSEEPMVEPTEPVSPLRLLRVQAQSLAPQVDGGAGMTAAALDELFPPGEAGELTVEVSRLIETWAAEAGTPAAELAAMLLAPPTGLPADVAETVAAADAPRFSDLVLLLFASDVATAGAATDDSGTNGAGEGADNPGEALGDAGAMHAAYQTAAYVDVGAACQATVGFAANVRATLVNALNKLIIRPPEKIGSGIFGSIITAIVHGAAGVAKTVVRGAQIFVDGVYQATVGQVLKFVGEVAGVVGTLAQVSSHVKAWHVDVGEGDPEVNQMAVVPATTGLPGTVTVRVTVPFDTWDPGLAQCAEAVGRPLPNLKPEGQRVTWHLDGYNAVAGLVLAEADGTRIDAQLTSEGTGQFGYRTGVEARPADNAPVKTGIVYPEVTIQRDDLTKLQEMIHSLVVDALTGALPLDAVPFVRQQVAKHANALLHKLTDRARQALERLRTTTHRGLIFVRYHGEPEDEADPPLSPGGTTDAMPRGCPAAGTVGPGFAKDYAVREGEGVACVYNVHSQGLQIVVFVIDVPTFETESGGLGDQESSAGRAAPGTWERIELEGAADAWFVDLGDCGGSHCLSVVASDGRRTLRVDFTMGSLARDAMIAVTERIIRDG